jgi:hypothetical protein
MLWRGYSARAARTPIASMIYAVMLPGDVIKIGYTTNLDQRISKLASVNGVPRGDIQVLGVRLGATFEDEQALHAKLSPYLHHGKEYYRPEVKVWRAINSMRRSLGLMPLTKWFPNGRWDRQGKYYCADKGR